MTILVKGGYHHAEDFDTMVAEDRDGRRGIAGGGGFLWIAPLTHAEGDSS